MLDSPSDYLLRGMLFGLVVEAVLAASAMLAERTFESTENDLQIATWLFMAVAICLVALLCKPVSLVTFLKSRRSPFMLEEDVRAMILGRTVGIALGLGFGITIATTLT